ncbi:hypothetical protein QOZ80_1BG0056200 [Eleusine coracana subsp. coracana]|nr:hypothetical protein QOZ80_1BG0056200 [Eleusine coracana subsp. coracana]
MSKAPGEKENGTVVCSWEGRLSESCEISGDIRVNGTSRSAFLVPTSQSEHREWQIRPYSRKNVDAIKKVTITQLPDDRSAAPACTTATYAVPAVLFALGGLTGNIFHDYADVLVPLFVASRRYAGEVQFLVANLGDRPAWPGKYITLLRVLSKYDVVDLDAADAHVMRCFRRLTVGLHIHKEFTVVPEMAAADEGRRRRRLAMADFTRFQREAYGLPRVDVAPREPGKRQPRLMLLRRSHYRRFVNEEEIVRAAAAAAGFEAEAVELNGDEMPVAEQARRVNSFDVLVAVHGAGLTTEVFLPPGGVVIQVVPFGKTEFIARVEYGEPAVDMGLKYIYYNIGLEESTLLEMFGPDHPAIRDPDSIHRKGWLTVYEYYLRKQDIRINITRFAPALAQAMDHLRRQH